MLSHRETGRRVKAGAVHLAALPEVSELLNLEEMSMVDFLAELKAGEIAEMVLLRPELSPEEINSFSVMDKAVLEELKKRCEARLGSEVLKNPKDPVYPLQRSSRTWWPRTHHRNSRRIEGFSTRLILCLAQSTVSPDSGLCLANNARSLMPSSPQKRRQAWCGSRNPRTRRQTFCVRKPNGKWRLVHAYNKLNSATVPAETPIPRKDVLLNNMAGCTFFRTLDLVDGYYQILMRESDIPLTAVSTPSGMLWEWLVMPQGLFNAPATFNRLVTQLV
ncbi:unnamed protein product [Phytophthora lilii]|uniref:Unnamed protein product n=1 Tax=Phytophthora lilii TaxID=2077276 RepID=A0A9W7CT51_9STRA|nr:unnamed protein product [Phytophthora lilii]